MKILSGEKKYLVGHGNIYVSEKMTMYKGHSEVDIPNHAIYNYSYIIMNGDLTIQLDLSTLNNSSTHQKVGKAYIKAKDIYTYYDNEPINHNK